MATDGDVLMATDGDVLMATDGDVLTVNRRRRAQD
jgi:hypothetical protein